MSSTRVIRRPVPKASKPEPSGGRWKWFASVVLLLLVAAGAWAFLPYQDPALARVEAIRAEMDGANDGQRRDLFRQMRDEMEKMSPEARREAFDGMRKRWEQREQQHLNEFFALSPQEQIAQIDKDLKRDEQRRKEWQQRRAQSNGNRGGQGRGGFGGPGGRGSRDSSDPNARRKSYLDNTNPQQRAMRGEYRRMRDERRQALGISGGGGGWHGR